MVETKPQGIVVLGMHRGGTSLIAKLMARWGAYGNEADMLGPDPSNPEGYWEYAPLVYFNDELLKIVDSRWNVPPRDSHHELLRALARDAELRPRGLSLIEEMRREDRPWFWKDPRLSVLLPFWRELWGDVVYVVVTRDPSDIALSLQSRDGLNTLTSLTLWQRYFSEILQHIPDNAPVYFASYERVLADTAGECSRLCRFLDSSLGMCSASEEHRTERMRAAVNPELWRSRGRPISQNPLATFAQKQLYLDTLRKTALPPSGDRIQTSVLREGWREELTEADHRLQRSVPNRCQFFWRNSDEKFEERRSGWTFVRESEPLTLQINLPPDQVKGKLTLRVDFSRVPCFLHLTEMKVVTAKGRAIWEWKGRADWFGQAECCQTECYEVTPDRGCLLRFTGDDPWVEIAMDAAQSAALSDGAALQLAGTYMSSAQALLVIKDSMQAELNAVREELKELRDERQLSRDGERRSLHSVLGTILPRSRA